MSNLVNNLIDEIIRVEGGYVNHPDDRGGPTKYGITLATLCKYRGTNLYTSADVESLTVDEVEQIYWRMYVADPGFDRLVAVSELVAAEVVDTGVNMGVETASRFLQRCLNALNDKQKFYPDLTVDGRVGTVTVNALSTYLTFRNEMVFLKALNCLQGARYVELVEGRERNESFVYGWLQQRVKL